jgi:hypothetical protein
LRAVYSCRYGLICTGDFSALSPGWYHCYLNSQGHDTTTAAICFALYLLGLHPEVQVTTDLSLLLKISHSVKHESQNMRT